MSGRAGQEGGTWRTLGGFLTEDLEDGVILEVMDDLGKVQGSCPEGFLELSLFLAEIYKIVACMKKRDRHTDTQTDRRQRYTTQI